MNVRKSEINFKSVMALHTPMVCCVLTVVLYKQTLGCWQVFIINFCSVIIFVDLTKTLCAHR